MTGEMEALARRAVACKGWRWMPGMQALGGVRVFDVMGDTFDGMDTDSEYLDAPTANLLPDLTDPATLGCLLAVTRKAWNRPYASISRWEKGWDWDGWWWACTSEAEALVAALEAAP